MKKYFHSNANFFLIVVLGFVFCFQACKKEENIKASVVMPEVTIVSSELDPVTQTPISRKVIHLYKDTVYLCKDIITREASEQLIIDEGTLIKIAGSGGFIINPGATITANGTADKPIVFTSNSLPGKQGINWQGITITGKSFNNANGTDGVADDFSGVLKFVRIEFAPLTLTSIGNKTVVENVMVSYTGLNTVTQDYISAFNIYGGNFNTRNLIAYACGGPADFFISNGYTGNMQGLIACRHPYFGSTGANPGNAIAGIFIQNNAYNSPAPLPFTNPVISNLTVIGANALLGSPAVYADTNSQAAALVTTRSCCFHLRNSLLLGYPAAGWILDDNATAVNLEAGNGEFDYSIIQSNTPSRLFYLAPGTYNNATSADFKNYMLGPLFSNRSLNESADFKFTNIVNYEPAPDLIPLAISPVLKGGANFDGTLYSNEFFKKDTSYIGAIGKENWYKKWANFSPLKTNYNFPN